MNKPKPKREVAVLFSNELVRHIRMNASADALNDLIHYGEITRVGTSHLLTVDGRYDFDEVVTYIKNYG